MCHSLLTGIVKTPICLSDRHMRRHAYMSLVSERGIGILFRHIIDVGVLDKKGRRAAPPWSRGDVGEAVVPSRIKSYV
jgi:hypothetical protein